jgi:uncharacterized protein (DUF488 family)
MTTIYTLGYATWALDEVRETAKMLGAVVVDVRLQARSSKPGFSKKSLSCELEGYYLHFPAFGNENYRNIPPGPTEIADFEAGRRRLKNVPRECGFLPETVILMCGCKDYRQCHRSELAARLSEPSNLDVVHLAGPPAESQHSLFDE